MHRGRKFSEAAASSEERLRFSFTDDFIDLLCCSDDNNGGSKSLVHSPLHLHGILKLRSSTAYEFTVESLGGDIYVANMKKMDSSLAWMYTFHSRKRNGIITRLSLLAKMKVSNTESQGDIETHCILYDPQQRNVAQEIIAIVMQHPLEMRQKNASSTGTIRVAVPAGRHTLPVSGLPSSLLHRLMYGGGGCDCGGWDVACPVTVLSNAGIRISSRNSLQLFFQGRRNERVPAFSMRFVEDGIFEVGFHAFLSSLQAFSISVAVLHCAAASTFATSAEETQQTESIIHAKEITEEGRRKVNPSPFVVNPPFSPIGR